jgi:hypothetical protein
MARDDASRPQKIAVILKVQALKTCQVLMAAEEKYMLVPWCLGG